MVKTSLGALRFIKKLVERNAAATVLGNHDLTLLAAARGIKAIKDKDNIRDVIDAIDSDDLIDWLRETTLVCVSKRNHGSDACRHSNQLDSRTNCCFSRRS